ncbi:CPBP family glutamic-type intramembrane protease [Marinilabilia sp.]|uniref:CPBP family glutamic-type intramembrane protease n=1 Tax=Marinilabilia sp. TaxID=2021252 RepID=UPI0025B9E457|nr:CPBP family glutamic-type intramembrane protease [Marinilabilia sp.]
MSKPSISLSKTGKKPSAPDRRKWFEIFAVFITGALKYILMDWLELRVFYIVSACLFWMIYILKRYQTDKQILQDWGFHKSGFKKTFLFGIPLAFLIIPGIILSQTNSSPLTWNLIPVLALYPFWGLIQQFLMISIIAGNLRSISSLKLKKNQVIIFVSFLFAMAHYPYWPLMVFTFAMEVVFIIAWLRWRNLLALGLLHGWLGGLFLYLVLERNLWNELWSIF